MSDRNLLYVYGVVRRGFDAASAPAGVEDAPVAVLDAGAFAVLASRVPGATFDPAVIEQRSGDMEWVSPRAVAHDRVMTWAQERAGIIPLPMFSLWSDAAAMRAGIAEREPQLRAAFERVADADEYGLRVHRRERDMLARVHELDAGIAELRREADAAPPGQRYLLERKIGEQAKQAVRAASQRLAKEAYAALQPLARAAMLLPLTPAKAPEDATMVLNAAFLVDRASFDSFRAELTRHLRVAEGMGLTFDFTGPWPPYNFVA